MITSFFKPKRDRASTTGKENQNAGKDSIAGQTTKKQKTTTTSIPKQEHSAPVTNSVTLVSYLNDDPSNNSNPICGDDTIITPTWKSALDKHFSSPSFKRLSSFVDTERQKHTIFPPPEDTFAALNLCPLSKTKLVIVGQDPYHGPNQAHGLCFSVRRGIKTPPSLRNIYKELANDPGVPNFTSIPNHGNLERWAKQGVLMINNVLTVRKGQAHSHKKKGWEELTDSIIRAIHQRDSDSDSLSLTTPPATTDDKPTTKEQTPRGVVFLLWGRPATEKTRTALNNSSTSKHTILCSSHPSPLGATKTSSPFMGSLCFSKANEALLEMGYDAIDWRVDGPLPP